MNGCYGESVKMLSFERRVRWLRVRQLLNEIVCIEIDFRAESSRMNSRNAMIRVLENPVILGR